MKQHKKNLDLHRLNIHIPKELHEWLKKKAKEQNKTQGLYLTGILEQIRKLQENA